MFEEVRAAAHGRVFVSQSSLPTHVARSSLSLSYIWSGHLTLSCLANIRFYLYPVESNLAEWNHAGGWPVMQSISLRRTAAARARQHTKRRSDASVSKQRPCSHEQSYGYDRCILAGIFLRSLLIAKCDLVCI